MSDLAIRADQQIDIPTGHQPGTAQLAQWVQAADAAYRLAETLCSTQFAPAAYRGKPQEGCAAILAGAEVGLSPLAALRAFDNIQGTPAPKAITLRAIVQSLGHEVRIDKSTATEAVVSGRRKGDTEWQTSTWDLERARQMGLLVKDQWKKQPAAMLIARATAEVCRWIASDAIMGMPYTAEEIRDQGPTVEARPAPRLVSAADFLDQPAAIPPVVAAIDDAVAAGASAPWEPGEREEMLAAAEPGITPDQVTKLHAAFTGAGIKSRDDKIATIVQVTGRVVGSSRELTKREASRVIDHLEGMPLPVEEPPADDEPGFDDWPDVAQPGGSR